MDKNELIDKPFKEYGFGNDFTRQCNAMGYNTLKDILNEPEGAMFKKKDFSYLWLEKLSGYLKDHGQLHLL